MVFFASVKALKGGKLGSFWCWIVH